MFVADNTVAAVAAEKVAFAVSAAAAQAAAGWLVAAAELSAAFGLSPVVAPMRQVLVSFEVPAGRKVAAAAGRQAEIVEQEKGGRVGSLFHC